MNHEFNPDWKARVTGFYGNYDKVYQNFYASGYDPSSNLVELDGYIDTTKRENFILNADIIGEFDTYGIGHKVIVGGEFVTTSSDQNRFNSFWNTTQDDNEVFNASNFRLRNGSAINAAGVRATNSFNTDLNDDTRVDIDVYSFYLQDEIALTPWLDAVAGARYDAFDIELFNAVNGETVSRRDEEISPRFGLIVKPMENVSIYGSYSESFLPRSGEQFTDINQNNRALDPNTYSNAEAGVKVDIKPNLSLTAAIFEAEESSPQISDADAGTLDIIDTVTSGFELQLIGFITDRWYISPGYSYLSGEQVDLSGGPNSYGDSTTGLSPAELPEHTFAIWNHYQATDRLGLGLGVVHQDDSFVNSSNTAILPAYTRVDAAIYYQLSDSWRLQVNIENLFDTEYFPNSHSTHQVTVGRPINAAFSIRGTF